MVKVNWKLYWLDIIVLHSSTPLISFVVQCFICDRNKAHFIVSFIVVLVGAYYYFLYFVLGLVFLYCAFCSR